jgi:phosphoenolpyruvate carboxykinase (ATP)
MLNAAISGALDGVSFRPDRAFGLAIPETVPGVPASVLDPREAWTDKAAYDRQAADLVARFEANFARFADLVDDRVREAGFRSAA